MNPYLFILYKKKFVRIRFEEIVYVLAVAHHCKIVTEKAVYLPYIQLNQIEKRLPSEHFVRINRGLLIPIDRIGWFDKKEILVKDHVMDITAKGLEELKRKIAILNCQDEASSDVGSES